MRLAARGFSAQGPGLALRLPGLLQQRQGLGRRPRAHRHTPGSHHLGSKRYTSPVWQTSRFWARGMAWGGRHAAGRGSRPGTSETEDVMRGLGYVDGLTDSDETLRNANSAMFKAIEVRHAWR